MAGWHPSYELASSESDSLSKQSGGDIMLTGDPKSIQELLTTSRYSLVNNQREYVWSLGGGQITDFLNDIQYYAQNSDEKWFLGQIVLLKVDEHDYKIIDGQQRLTTICLFLAACRDRARVINNTSQQAVMQNYISFVSGTDGSVEGLRVTVSKTIKQLFDSICTVPDFDFSRPADTSANEWKKQIKALRNIFDAFTSHLRDKDQQSLNRTITALLNAYVFRLVSQDAAETYSLFEDTNAKGTPLEATDLLKNLLMERMGDNQTTETAWNEIANNSGSTGVRMLRYFYTSSTGALERGNIYRRVRDNLVNRHAARFVDEYRAFSQFYRTMEEDASLQSVTEMLSDVFKAEGILQNEPAVMRIYHAIQGIQLFQIKLCYPLIYSLLREFSTGDQTEPARRRAIVRIIQTMEKYHFVNTIVCDSRANKVETLYAEYCNRIGREGVNLIQEVDRLIGVLKSRDYTEGEDVFTVGFREFEYSDTKLRQNRLLYYIFDRFNNFNEVENREVDPGVWTEYYSPSRARRHIYSIEHYSPQTPEGVSPIENVHNIGNLFIIGSELNGRLGRLPTQRKIEKLRGEFYQDIISNKMLKEFVDSCSDEWGVDWVNQRANDLAKRAYNYVWKIP